MELVSDAMGFMQQLGRQKRGHHQRASYSRKSRNGLQFQRRHRPGQVPLVVVEDAAVRFSSHISNRWTSVKPDWELYMIFYNM